MLRLQLPTCNPPTLQHTHAHTHTHTHRMEVVCTFNLPAKVAAVAMSHLATSHCLIASGCHDPHLRLCDPASGAFTHTLVGHRYGTDSLCVVCHAHSSRESCKHVTHTPSWGTGMAPNHCVLCVMHTRVVSRANMSHTHPRGPQVWLRIIVCCVSCTLKI